MFERDYEALQSLLHLISETSYKLSTNFLQTFAKPPPYLLGSIFLQPHPITKRMSTLIKKSLDLGTGYIGIICICIAF